MDIFAESIDKRVCIEIQRIEYDIHFDRFLHYFLMLITEQQKSSKEYKIERTVYVIVVLTAPYKINEKNGKPILDEVLLLKLNPQTLQGEFRDLYGHQFVCLNPNHKSDETPKQIRDWLNLIYESIHNPENPNLNMENEGIKKATELINFENLTPEERTKAKNKEAAKIVIATTEKYAKEEGKIEGKIEGKQERNIEIAKKLIKRNLSNQEISEDTDLTLEQIQELRNELNQ